MGKHDMTERLVAYVPNDSYYKAQIKTLQDKLDKMRHEVELKDAYIESLEASKRVLEEKVEHLRKVALGMLEEKFNV